MSDEKEPDTPDDPNVDEMLADLREWWGDYEDERQAVRGSLRQSLTRKWQAEDSADHDHPLLAAWGIAVVWWWMLLTRAAADVRRRATDLRRRVAAWVRWRVRPRIRAWHAWSWLRMQAWLVDVRRRRSATAGRFAAPGVAVRAWWHGWGDRPDEIGSLVVGGTLSAVGVVGGAWASIQAAAGAGFGALIGLLWWTVAVGAASVAIAPWFIFPALPGFLRLVLARLWLLLLQLAHGGTAVVERESGELELQPLWEHGERRWATETSDGDELVVDDANVTRWWFFPFAFVVELGDNLAELREDPQVTLAGGGDRQTVVGDGAGELIPTGTRRADSRELKPTNIADDEQLLSLIPLRPRLRNAASGAFARDGRDEGLRAEGGKQQLSPLVTIAFAFAALIIGFGLVHFTL